MGKIFIILVLITLSCFASDTNNFVGTAGEEDELNMILSQETNSMKSGIWINDSSHMIVVEGGQMVTEANLVMLNTSTNEVRFWEFWPSTNLGYQINMLDEYGNEVPKTSFGEKFWLAPKKNPDNTWTVDAEKFGLHGGKILPKDEVLWGSTQFDPIKNLPKCFELEKYGNYKLILIHHIYMPEFHADRYVLRPVTFSPVTIDVRVEK